MEILLTVYFYIFGVAVNRIFLNKNNFTIIFLSLPTSIAVWAIIMYLLIIFQNINLLNIHQYELINFSLIIYNFLFLSLIFIFLRKMILKRLQFKFEKIFIYLIPIFFIIILHFINNNFALMQITSDSLSWSIWENDFFYNIKLGYPIFLQTIISLYSYVNIDYYPTTLHYLISISFIFFILKFSINITEDLDINFKIKIFIYFTLISLICFNFMFFKLTFYSNHNLLSSFYLLIFFYFINNHSLLKYKNFFLSFIIIVFCVIRFENFFLSIIIIFLQNLLLSKDDYEDYHNLYLLFLLMFFPFLILFYLNIEYVNKLYFLISYALFLINFILIKFDKNKLYKKLCLFCYDKSIFIILLIILLILVFDLGYSRFNLVIFFSNFLNIAYWGVSNIIIFYIFIVFLFNNDLNDKYYNNFKTTFILFLSIFIIVSFRFDEPLRYGWSDSANRIIFTIFPLLVLFAYRIFVKRYFKLFINI